jgi:hypothetical protein
MTIETSGEILIGTCEIQTELCVARSSAPVTFVWIPPGRGQVRVCGTCLEEMVRNGEWEIPGARVNPRHDVVVLDRHGRPRLFIDVKRLPGGADVHDWARRVHHNLVYFSGLPAGASYLLVGYPDRFFGWAPPAARDPDGAPTYEAECAEVLAPFLPAPGSGGDDLAVRERVVADWMESLLASDPSGSGGPARWLADSGVLDTVRGSFVARQLAAA